jgi:hypothetical protein
MAGWQRVRMKREAMPVRAGPWWRGGRARRRRCTSVEVKREGRREAEGGRQECFLRIRRGAQQGGVSNLLR